MNKMIYRINCLLVLILVIALFSGCGEEPTKSLFDPDAPTGATPVISQVVPADSTLSGIGQMIIKGQNFSSVPTENFVFFNDTRAEVLSATSTELTIKTPILVGDTNMKIAVHQAELFSNIIKYRLLETVGNLVSFTEAQIPYAITCDASGNVYLSLVESNAGRGVQKVTPDGTMGDYAPKGGETFWAALKVGPNGIIYGVRQVRAIFQIASEGAAPTTWTVIPTTTVKLADIDFDSELNMWAVGNNQEIFRIKPDKTINGFPFVGDVRSVRIFNNYVYLAGGRESVEKIWRLQIISADELGPEEVYFDFSAAYPGYFTKAITFDKNGDLYVGTDAPESIIVVHADGTHEGLYFGLFHSSTISFAWGTGTYLYATREGSGDFPQTILKIQMLKEGAPYFGRGDTP